ncbi:unnamed protein product, partial [Cuscuta epithymum]
MNMAGLTLE